MEERVELAGPGRERAGGHGAGMGEVAGRTATLIERVGVTDKAFTDALVIAKLSGEAGAANAVRASAGIGDVRPVQQFRHTLSELVLRRMAVGTPEVAARSARFVQAVERLTGTGAYRAIGAGAMATNLVSMGHEGDQLIKAGSNASGSDWMQFLTSAGLMAVGYGAAAHGQEASPEDPSSEGVGVVTLQTASPFTSTTAPVLRVPSEPAFMNHAETGDLLTGETSADLAGDVNATDSVADSGAGPHLLDPAQLSKLEIAATRVKTADRLLKCSGKIDLKIGAVPA